MENNERLFKEVQIEKSVFEEKIAEQENQIDLLANDYQQQLALKEQKYIDQEEEKKQLRREIFQLKREVEYKHNEIVESDKNLLENGDKAQLIIKETCTKLQHSIIMANEFKNRVIELEDDNKKLKSELVGEKSQQESQNTRLRESLDLLQQQSEIYEQKIFEEQQINSLAKQEMVDVKDQNQYFRRIISDLKIDLKKYEYEVEFLHDKNHQKTNEFISNLHSSFLSNPQARSPDPIRNKSVTGKEYDIQMDDIKDRINKLKKNIEITIDSAKKRSSEKMNPERLRENFHYRGRQQFPEDLDDLQKSVESFHLDEYGQEDLNIPSSSFYFGSLKPQNTLSGTSKDYYQPRQSSVKNTPKNSNFEQKHNIYYKSNKTKKADKNQKPYFNEIDISKHSDSNSLDLENARSVRNQVRENLEYRIQKLNESLEKDLISAQQKSPFF